MRPNTAMNINNNTIVTHLGGYIPRHSICNHPRTDLLIPSCSATCPLDIPLFNDWRFCFSILFFIVLNNISKFCHLKGSATTAKWDSGALINSRRRFWNESSPDIFIKRKVQRVQGCNNVGDFFSQTFPLMNPTQLTTFMPRTWNIHTTSICPA